MSDMINGVKPETVDDYTLWRDKVAGANINQKTLLATDYLNHFNEIVMLVEMIEDAPEVMDICASWEPKGYQEHFRGSSFKDKGLAISAYNHAPDVYRVPFEKVIARINTVTCEGLPQIKQALQSEDRQELVRHTRQVSSEMRMLIDVASSIIHGSEAMAQNEIDAVLG